MHKLAGAFRGHAVREPEAGIPTTADRTFDYHPKWEEPSGIPKETKPKN